MSEQQINYDSAKAWLEETVAYQSRQFGKLQQLPTAYFHIVALLKDIDAINAKVDRYEKALKDVCKYVIAANALRTEDDK